MVSTWGWEIFIGARRFRQAASAYVYYDRDGAGALELVVEADLSGMARAPVRVLCGYGGTVGRESEEGFVEWFTGDLARPDYDPVTGTTSVEAYGVIGAMSRQDFEEPTTFQGTTLRGFFATIRRLLYDPRARIDVVSGNLSIEDTVFPGEDSLREGSEAILEGFDHVMRETPGFGLVVTPRPRPKALGKYTAVLSKSDFRVENSLGDFRDNPARQPEMESSGANSGPYAKVIVHRRDQSGFEIVWAEAEISNTGPYRPKPNEIYWVHDFDGDQNEAQNTARSTARALTIDAGEVSGVARNLFPKTELRPGEPMLIKLTEEQQGGDYRIHYASVVTECGIDLVNESMDVSFEAIQVLKKEITRQEVPPPASPYVIASDGNAYATAFGEDGEGVFFRLGYAVDYAGEDSEGFYVVPSEADPGEIVVEDPEEGLSVEVSP